MWGSANERYYPTPPHLNEQKSNKSTRPSTKRVPTTLFENSQQVPLGIATNVYQTSNMLKSAWQSKINAALQGSFLQLVDWKHQNPFGLMP